MLYNIKYVFAAVTVDEWKNIKNQYILDKKNGIKYDGKELVKHITEYFLIHNELSDRDLEGYRKVLRENPCITDDDITPVNYIIEPDNDNPDTIIKWINSYLVSQDKDINLFNRIICSCINDSDTLPQKEILW